ncbi:MAG: heavy metal-associated domain-containing protein [Deferrisomatales bacterium]|nr:heavy metal-associated domain-containing protein [Deferrisomatales bacterium]
MNRRKCLLAVAGWIGALVLGPSLGLRPGHARAEESREAALALEGLTCAACAFAVKAALKRLDGVRDAKVSYRNKTATVFYDPAQVSPQELVAAVEQAGFRASIQEPSGH